MEPHNDIGSLQPIEQRPYQVYFTNRLQLADVIEWVLTQIGCAELLITTFSTSELFLRRMLRLKTKGLVSSCSLYCDIRAARKTLSIYSLMQNAFDNVFLCANHSKIVLFSGAAKKVAIITSQNQTTAERFECGMIIADENIYETLLNSFDLLKSQSYPLHELIRGNFK